MQTDWASEYRSSTNPRQADHAADSERPNSSIVGGLARNRSGYRSGDIDYGPGMTWRDFTLDPRNRTAPGGAFRPYRERNLTQILNRIVNQGSIMDLQLALMQAGFLSDEVTFGYIDSDTEDAFAQVLALANQHGIRWEDALSQAAAAGGMDDGGGGPGGGGDPGGGGLAPTVITLPNRDDLIAAIEDAGMTLTGQRLDDDLHESAADAVLDSLRTQQERQVQQELAAMSSGAGGTLFLEGPPDAGRLLEEEIRERAPGLVMSKGVRDTMDLWNSLLQGPG